MNELAGVDQPILASSVYHGGDLAAARAAFPTAPEPWLDLSTGINPNPYPLPVLSSEAWARLPDRAALARLEAVAIKLRATLDRSREPAEPYPSPAVLGARNIELQEVLAELQEALHENPVAKNAGRLEIDVLIRDLLRRMLARELEINSPALP